MFERIACIGGATLDRKIRPLGKLRGGTSNPVRSESCSGGAVRNVAEALARLGCSVSLFSRLGRDAAGELILGELQALGIDPAGVDQATGSPTASYTALLNEAGELVFGLADMEILEHLDESWLDPIVERLGRHDLWILDTNLPAPLLERLVRSAPEAVRIYADPVSVDKSTRLRPILDRLEAVFPDRAEAAALCGADPVGSASDLATRVQDLGPRRVLVSLGADGVAVEDPPRRERVPAMATSAVIDVSGAGDCFLAGYVFAHTVGPDLDPVGCGLAAAAFAVESSRTVPLELTAERLLQRTRGGG